MARRKITAADICEVTGYTRDQLRGLLQKLPPYADRAGSPRIAREFSRHDLLVLSIAIRLEAKLGLQRAAIGAVVEQIYAELHKPRAMTPSPLLHISLDPPSITYLTNKQVEIEGTMIALEPVFKLVDDYLDGDIAENVLQPSLPFGPSLASQRRQYFSGK